MKLLIRRSSGRSRLGTLTFSVHARLEVVESELELIDACAFANESIHTFQTAELGNTLLERAWALKENQRITVGKLVTGTSITSDFLLDLLEAETGLREGCLALERYLSLAADFSGEDVFDLQAMLEAEVAA